MKMKFSFPIVFFINYTILLFLSLLVFQNRSFGQFTNGVAEFKHSELKSRYKFEYSTTVLVNNKRVDIFGNGTKVKADFSKGNGTIRVNLYGLYIDGPARNNDIQIQTKAVWVNPGSDLELNFSGTQNLKPGRVPLTLEFKPSPNAHGNDSDIRIEFTATNSGNPLEVSSLPYILIRYKLTPFVKIDDSNLPPPPEDPIDQIMSELDIQVAIKKGKNDPEWYKPYLNKYDGTSDSKIRNPLEKRLEGCCKELYEASKTREKLEEFIRLYNVGNRLNCQAFGSFISKAYEKLNNLPLPKDPPVENPNPPTSMVLKPGEGEKAAWKRTQSINTIHAYDNYKRRFPNGEHYNDATVAIQKIKQADEQAYSELNAELNNTNDTEKKKAICLSYLKKQPNVNFRSCHELANKIMTELSTFFVSLQQPQPGGVDFLLIVKSPKALDPQVEVSYNGIRLKNEELETGSWIKTGGGNIYEKTYKYLEPGDYTFRLKFQDASFKEEKFKINSSLPPTVRVNGNVLRIIGGIPPFKIYYSTNDNEPAASQQFAISKDNPQQRLFIIEDLFKEIDYKKLSYVVVDNDDQFIGDIQPLSKPSDWFFIIIRLFAFLAICFVVYLLLYQNKEPIYTWMARQPVLLNQFKWLESYKKSIKKVPSISTADATIAILPAEKLSVKIKDPKDISKEPSIGIRIKTPDVKGAPVADAGSMLHDRGYTSVEPSGNPSFYPFELDELWLNTAVSKVYIHRRCVADIEIVVNNYLMKCVADSVAKPEVGGFLMGQYGQYSDGRYFVVFYEYIKAHTTAHDEYEVELAMEDIDDPLLAVPEFGLMGWFHTHPGHTVFLSGRDLNIQKTHFNRPYQIAMETDPVSPNYDLSFFSWQNGSGLNEGASNRINPAWFSWKTLNDWVRAIR